MFAMVILTVVVTGSSTCPPFKNAPEYFAGDRPLGVTVADLDSDGKPDVATVFSGSAGEGIFILRNLGNGVFQAGPTITPLPEVAPQMIYSQDLDVDGRPDLIVTNASTSSIAVYRNISAGPGQIMFAPRTRHLVAGEQARQIDFGDMDGDGQIDIVIATPNGTNGISVLRNISGGTGTITLAPSVNIAVPNTHVLTISDFDGDGRLDVALGRTVLRVLRNTSSGAGDISFSVVSFSFSVSIGGMFDSADFDSDGKPDVVTVNSSSRDGIGIIRNTSTGPGNINFAEDVTFRSADGSLGLFARDFNADGKVDVATVNYNGNDVSVFLNASTGPGDLKFAARPWDFGAGSGAYRFALGDLNNDGKLDFVTANLDADSVSVLLAAPGPSVDFLTSKHYVSFVYAGITSVAAGDFDGDGDLDVAATLDETANAFGFSIYVNDGNGHFPVRVDIHTLREPTFGAAGDFNGDGRADLVLLADVPELYRSTSSGPGNISFVFDGSLQNVVGLPRSVTASDLNSDGKADLVVSFIALAQSTGTALVYRNVSQPSGVLAFSTAGNFEISKTPNFWSDDFDQDGRNDLVHHMATNSPPAHLRVRQNIGGGSAIEFGSQDLGLGNLALGSSVVIEDLDLDGKKDILTDVETTDISFFKNTSVSGAISFDSGTRFANAFLDPAASGDFDGDGKKDVLMTNVLLTGSFVTVARNTTTPGGSFSFDLSRRVAYGANPNGSNYRSTFAVGDFNNDGRLDAVSGFFGSTGILTMLLGEQCEATASAPFDFDGDSKTDISIFRPSVAQWWINRSSNASTFVATFGASSDSIVPADYTGDGKADVAIWRPASGEWFVLRSEDSSFYSFPFGTDADIPAPADYDADGKTDATVFRPTNSTWYVRRSGDGGTTIQQFGATGDVPVPSDYDGDGKSDIAIFRPSVGQWWMNRSTAGVLAVTFGNSSDKLVQGDYTGDGKSDNALFRPSTGEWVILRSDDFSFYSFPFGTSTDIPAPGDYDGDGKFDATVFRSSNATWYSQRSTAGTLIQQFGSTGDRPVPNAFVP